MIYNDAEKQIYDVYFESDNLSPASVDIDNNIIPTIQEYQIPINSTDVIELIALGGSASMPEAEVDLLYKEDGVLKNPYNANVQKIRSLNIGKTNQILLNNLKFVGEENSERFLILKNKNYSTTDNSEIKSFLTYYYVKE